MKTPLENAQLLPRVFKIGPLRLEDPCPGRTLQEAVRILSRNYPQFRSYTLYEEDGVVEESSLVYELKAPPAKING
ncbi:MAG: hypothetical protein GKR90_25545 [Pseudomonadales bacterium]|nr:hypothetical protein [Pseudomonadales bacterium]